MIVSCDVVQRPPKNIGLLLLTLKECGSRLCADGAEKVADFIKIIERAEFCERVCIKEREKRDAARSQDLRDQGKNRGKRRDQMLIRNAVFRALLDKCDNIALGSVCVAAGDVICDIFSSVRKEGYSPADGRCMLWISWLWRLSTR